MDKSGTKIQLLEVQPVRSEESSILYWNIGSLKGKTYKWSLLKYCIDKDLSVIWWNKKFNFLKYELENSLKNALDKGYR